jgi:hypothetical protein
MVAFPSGVLPWSTPDRVASVLWLLSYAFLAALVVRNFQTPGFVLIAAGQACNLVAIIANGGHMPVTRGALDGAGLAYDLRNNSIALAHPHLSFLVDRRPDARGLNGGWRGLAPRESLILLACASVVTTSRSPIPTRCSSRSPG